MKIVCLIDHLNSGGAQRQMCMLAPLLKEAGFEVEVLTYFPHDFFAHLLQQGAVPWRVIPWKNKLQRIGAVRKALRDAKPDGVIAFLETPSLMAELAMWPDRPFKLIVSERNTTLKPAFKDKVYYNLHRLADAVVPNSYSQQKVLEQQAPFLKDKIRTITNCVDLDKYKPADAMVHNDPMQILVLARHESQKNASGLAKAMSIVKKRRPVIQLAVHWYGRRAEGSGAEIFEDLKEEIREHSLQNCFLLFEPAQDVIPLFHQSDVVCMPSFYEGCSNVIAEAMACGKPILAGDVCDNRLLVKNEQNGLLFDPKSPEDIANALIRFSDIPVDRKMAMGCQSRKWAEEILSPERCLEKYVDLIAQLAG